MLNKFTENFLLIMLFILLQIVISSNAKVFAAEERLCDLLKVYECPDERSHYNQSVAASHPTSSSMNSVNPAAMNVNKGIGIEVIKYGVHYDASLISGTGKVGAGLAISFPEDTFFGNMSVESVDSYMRRVEKKEQYKAPKYSLATALSISKILFKRNNKYFDLKAGGIFKFHEKTKDLLVGGGGSVEFGPLSFGVATYKDQFVDRSINQEFKYRVRTNSVGLKLPYFAVDWIRFENQYPVNSKIYLTSISGFYKKLILSYGVRKEVSYRPEYNRATSLFTFTTDKHANFIGIQFGLHKYFIAGLLYNYYLLNETSFVFTAFI